MVADPGRCPSPDDLERLLGDDLGDADRTAVEAHVETCAPCQQRLERLVSPADSPPVPTGSTADAPSIGPEPDKAFLERLRQLPLATRTGFADGESTADRTPSNLGPYDILGHLGRGGMGTVYRARHRELDKVVALKVLPAGRVDEAAVARFRNEMRAAGRLTHPNIVVAHDAGRVGGTYYLAMEIVDGSDLSALVERLGPLPIPDACELVRQAAVGLQHACDCGLAHRDVKPSNLMLARGGVVKVLDLGLARSLADLPAAERLTVTGVMVGTADYVAPEQIDQAHTADARADVYGLGGTLYFLLAGTPPFGHRSSWLEKLRAHAKEPPPPVRKRRPEVPATLAAVLERMLAKKPDDRPATPGAVAEALQPFTRGADPARLLDLAPAARPRPVGPPAGTRRRVRGAFLRYGLTAAAGAAIALLAAAPFLGSGREGSPQTSANAPPGNPPPVTPPEEVEGVRLTFGPHGPPRPDHKVLPGEVIDLEYAVTGIGKDPAGEVNFAVAGELVDQAGKRWAELAAAPRKGPLYLGGSSVSGWVSVELAAAQPPGEYKARARLTDGVTGRVVNFEHPVYVLRPEFGATRLRLTHDGDGTWPAGSHLALGQQFFVRGRAVSFARKDGRVHVGIAVAARDRDGKDTALTPLKPLDFDQKVKDDFTYFDFTFGPLKAIMAGEVTIGVELRDVTADKVAKYELPVVIHPPRSIRK